ncbi:Surface antigen variable number repeat-containing protein [Flexibacter flexilis DSM 6793]|uniref:Surface antigen variable number repeat-containing protein n=2 Tax=Flexibacter flexilis TaxID=998 RepID=A0A1I1GZH7_9BACT|nr:Surface antigen variable number repeat-containing protein [Flexibacter flexilis DSM 6793]
MRRRQSINIIRQIAQWLICMALAMPCGEVFAQTPTTWTVDSIRIEGNRRTKPYIILRELTGLFAGDTVRVDTALLFRQNANQIYNTQLFLDARVRSVPTADSTTHRRNIIITVSERWYTFPFPIIELADRSFNEWWYNRGADLRRINYGIRFTQNNCRGRKETFKATFQWGFTHKLEAAYTIPYINRKLNSGLMLGISYITNNNIAYITENNKLLFFKNDTKVARTRFITRLAYDVRQHIFGSHHAEIGWARNTVVDTVARWLNPSYFGNGSKVQHFGYVAYRYSYDRRDRKPFARKGFYFIWEIEKWGLSPKANVQSGATRLTFSYFKTLSPKWFWGIRTEAEWLFTPTLPYYNYKTLGYDMRVVRGYEKYVVEGRAPVLVKNSFRYKFLDKNWHYGGWKRIPNQFRSVPLQLYLQGHGDLGYVYQPQHEAINARLSNTLLAGVGAGLVVVTFYDLVFRFEYSLNRQGERNMFFYLNTDI